jgi:hypothetical protein
MAKKQNDDPETEPQPTDETAEPRLALASQETPTAQSGETTRVLLTGDSRDVVTEAYVPTEAYGFRINVNGQWYEHVGEAADSGTWIFAPTR